MYYNAIFELIFSFGTKYWILDTLISGRKVRI